VQDRAYKFTTVESPIGPLELVAREYALCATSWERDDSNRVRIGVAKQEEDGPHLRGAKTQIGAYGAGRRRAFDLPSDFVRTAFQQAVWSAPLRPIAIIASCHRVTGANGGLAGFAGDVAAEAYLLRLEQGQTCIRL
jgi:methylated-DNA-[protein]-cysteine S-methyltransferase